MPEIKQVFADGIFRLSGPDELGEVDGLEAEAKHIDGLHAFPAARQTDAGRTLQSLEAAGIAFDGLMTAISVPSDTETQFQVILCGILFPDVVDDHPHIVKVQLGMSAVPPDGVLHGAGDLPILFHQDVEVVL